MKVILCSNHLKQLNLLLHQLLLGPIDIAVNNHDLLQRLAETGLKSKEQDDAASDKEADILNQDEQLVDHLVPLLVMAVVQHWHALVDVVDVFKNQLPLHTDRQADEGGGEDYSEEHMLILS